MSDSTALYKEKTELLKAPAHSFRPWIARGLLKCGCRNVGCMEANTGQSQSCISQHLMCLKAAGVIKTARSDDEVYYEIANPGVAAVLSALFDDREKGY